MENLNSHLSEATPLDEEKESRLKEGLLYRLSSCNSLQDLAEIKKESLACDERTHNRQDIHAAIIKRFEEVLVGEVHKLPNYC